MEGGGGGRDHDIGTRVSKTFGTLEFISKLAIAAEPQNLLMRIRHESVQHERLSLCVSNTNATQGKAFLVR